MKVIVRFPSKREVEFSGAHRVQDILKELRLNPESVVVLHGKKLLTRDSIVPDSETVEVLSAISGGSGHALL